MNQKWNQRLLARSTLFHENQELFGEKDTVNKFSGGNRATCNEFFKKNEVRQKTESPGNTHTHTSQSVFNWHNADNPIQISNLFSKQGFVKYTSKKLALVMYFLCRTYAHPSL